jgi:hypothetical protein
MAMRALSLLGVEVKCATFHVARNQGVELSSNNSNIPFTKEKVTCWN